jgi:NAD(P)-dependent dehydrogenase (short-subunit alcohol dehydrogenase family)
MYLDRFNLKSRVAVVTGGAQGIGLACVEALSEAGAYVYIADRNLKVAQEAQAAMKARATPPESSRWRSPTRSRSTPQRLG